MAERAIVRPMIIGLVFSALIACTGRESVRPVAEAPAPAIEGPVAVERLREALFFNRVQAIRAEADVRVFGKDGKSVGSFKGAFLYRSPGAIRLRLFDPFGGTVMDMVKSGSAMQVYLPTENTLYEGWTPPIGIPPDALFHIEKEKDRYILWVFRPGTGGVLDLYGKFFFDRASLKNTGMAVYSGGERFMELSFKGSSGKAPEEMGIAFFNGLVVRLELVEPEVDREVPREAFLPIDHEGKPIQPLRALLNRPFK